MFIIGKSIKGTVVHAINNSGKNNHALCDKRQTGMIVDATLDVTAITCSKCLQRAEVKKTLAELMGKKPESPDEKPKESAGIPVSDKKRSKKNRGGEKKPFPALPLNPKPARTPVPPTEEVEIIEDDGDFFAKIKTDGRFKIIHKSTGKVFFDSVPEEIVLDAIIKLNTIKDHWESTDSPLPDNYISRCRKALHDAYSENNKVVPKNLLDLEGNKKEKKSKKSKLPTEDKTEKTKKGDTMIAVIDGHEVTMVYDGKRFVSAKVETKEKQKRVLKRREKPKEKIKEEAKRTIKRRDKKEEEKPKRIIKRRNKENTLLGRIENTPGHTVLELLQEGVTFGKLLAALEIKHGLNQKRARAKIRGIIRKTCRKQNIPVNVTLTANPVKDFYKIATLKKGS